ncbi:MAG: hypothetical protein P9M02_02185 [Candidatus Susulua stagnicola]|nr:hypothetical protein [Candidatus Susulua stagnicola]
MMKLEDWLKFFKEHSDIKIFHFNHFKMFSNMKSHSLRIALKRLADKNIIKRVCRGYYANPFSIPTIEEISAQIYKPSYVSLESVLSNNGILSQIPQALTCVTAKTPRVFDTVFGTIEYRQIKKTYFWGLYKEGNYLIAEPEKALVDFIYFRKKKDVERSISGLDFRSINRKKLKNYAEKMGIELRGHLT